MLLYVNNDVKTAGIETFVKYSQEWYLENKKLILFELFNGSNIY